MCTNPAREEVFKSREYAHYIPVALESLMRYRSMELPWSYHAPNHAYSTWRQILMDWDSDTYIAKLIFCEASLVLEDSWQTHSIAVHRNRPG